MAASSTAATQRRLADEFVQGYNDFTTEGILRPRAEDCEHHMLPANLNRPARTNKDYEKSFGVLKENMSDFKMTPHRFVNDPEEKTIAVYATGTAKTPWGDYDNSYVFFLKCEGERIVRIDEFVDSKHSVESSARMHAYLESQARRGCAYEQIMKADKPSRSPGTISMASTSRAVDLMLT